MPYLKRLKTADEVEKHELFITIPLESKNINVTFQKKIKLRGAYSFLWSEFDESG